MAKARHYFSIIFFLPRILYPDTIFYSMYFTALPIELFKLQVNFARLTVSLLRYENKKWKDSATLLWKYTIKEKHERSAVSENTKSKVLFIH